MNYSFSSKDVEISFDRNTGAIISLLNRNTGWQVIRQPKLSMGICLLVPIENYRDNRVLSEFQKLSSFEKIDEEKVILKWEKIKGTKSGNLDISVLLTVILKGSNIYFKISIDNQSPYIVEEVWCPCLGGLREPKGEPTLESLSLQASGGLHKIPLGDGFPRQATSDGGYWSTYYPTFIKTFPDINTQLSFIVLTNDKQGIYMGLHDKEINIINFVHELKPGFLDSKHSRVPMTDEISGKASGFVVSAVRMPFIQSGESMKLAPIVISLFKGTWHKAIETYKNWRNHWYKLRPQPKWLHEIDCWLTLHINSPEGCTEYHYSELINIAIEAKRKGVGVIQLIGWARDGQDGAEPYQDTDPRLGTQKEFKKAIKKIEDMGIRILLMCKFKWADQSIPEFLNEIVPLTLKDMYGNYVQFNGWAYHNMSQQLIGGSRRSGAGLCHLSKKFRKLAIREFKKIIALGSSGILYDELINPMMLCFDLNHEHRWGECNIKGTLKLTEEFYKLGNKLNHHFLMAGEGSSDHLSQYYSISYVRTWDGTWGDWYETNHVAAYKYINQDVKIATCITGWDDRDMINQCITYGYILNYEPYNFKGRITDIPKTVAYGQKAQRLRRRLWDYIWNGKFTDTIGAKVEVKDDTLKHIYSVFENNRNGKKAVVVANQDYKMELKAKVTLDNNACDFKLYDIEIEGVKNCKGNITVKSRSLVVLVER